LDKGHKDISFYLSINGNDADFNHTLRRGEGGNESGTARPTRTQDVRVRLVGTAGGEQGGVWMSSELVLSRPIRT